MKAACFINSNGAATLIVREIAMPEPGPGEVLIQVHAAGVTLQELQWYPTLHMKNGASRQLAVPGHEFSGVVSNVGLQVDEVNVGDEVYGMNDWFADGATAEYCVTVPQAIAPKPKTLSHVEAAAVPISALTALQGLFDRAKLEAGERVLIQGGAGGVGSFAVQLARHRGAKVVATASRQNLELVRELGADEAWDYRLNYHENNVESFDVVFDVVGGESLKKARRLLKPGGRMVTVASDSEGGTDEATKAAFFIVEPRRSQLLEMSGLLEAGVVHPVINSEIPFANAGAAYFPNDGVKHGTGKVVIKIS